MGLLQRDMACQQAVELVTDYLEGALSRSARRRFERHLRACPACRQYLEQMRITIATASHVDTESIDPDTREGLVDLFRRFHDGSPPP